VALAALAGPAIGLGSGPAGAAPAYTAIAAADGARLTFLVPNGPGTDTPIDGGGPSAQATVSSSGDSQAFASLPYPGEVAVTAPGLLAAVGVAGVPQYPLYAASAHPTAPEAVTEAPGYRLEAASTEGRSTGTASAGQAEQGPWFLARASIAPADGDSVVAGSESTARELRAGPLVIGQATATARVTQDGKAGVHRTSSFDMTGAAIGETAVTIGPDGFRLAGSNTPLPAGDPLLKPLADNGLTVRYLAPIETERGIVSAGLSISALGRLPDGQAGTVTLTLGRATASIAGAAAGESNLTVGGPSPIGEVDESGSAVADPPSSVSPGQPSPASGEAGLTLTDGAPLAPVPASSSSGIGSGFTGAGGSDSGDRTGSPPPAQAGDELAAQPRPAPGVMPVRPTSNSFDAANLYPMLVVAVTVANGLLFALRRIGRQAWNS
jgi:hypothetical protein